MAVRQAIASANNRAASLGGNAQSDGSRDLHIIKTIDNSMMIAGPVGEAYCFAIDAAIDAALSAI
jgi:hypothetical protein